jgi:hypothetical protein
MKSNLSCFSRYLSGIIPTLVGVIPYGAIAFTVNETGKKFMSRDTNAEPTTLQKLLCGALAGNLYEFLLIFV